MAAAAEKEPTTPTQQQQERAAVSGDKPKRSAAPSPSGTECKNEVPSCGKEGDVWWSCGNAGCSYVIKTSANPKHRSSMKSQHMNRCSPKKIKFLSTRKPNVVKLMKEKVEKAKGKSKLGKVLKKNLKTKLKKGKVVKPRRQKSKGKAGSPSQKTLRKPRSIPAANGEGQAKKEERPKVLVKRKVVVKKTYKTRRGMLRAVWRGMLKRTPGGLTKEDLCVSHRGRIVPKRRSAHSKKNCAKSGWAENWRHWCKAHSQIRRENGIKTFLKVKKDGSALQKDMYLRVLERWAESKAANITSRLSTAGSRISYQLVETAVQSVAVEGGA